MAEEIAVFISAQWEFLFQPKPSAPKSQAEAQKKKKTEEHPSILSQENSIVSPLFTASY